MLKSLWVISNTMVELNHTMADWMRTPAHITYSFTFRVTQSKHCFGTPYFAKNNFIRKYHITIYIATHQYGTQTQSFLFFLFFYIHGSVHRSSIFKYNRNQQDAT
jgi:hypothetical protein